MLRYGRKRLRKKKKTTERKLAMAKTKRIIIAILGCDAQGRGTDTVAHALRDAGMEVIYLRNETPEGVVHAALQEDADVIGLSSFSGNHMALAPEVMRRLRAAGAGDIAVLLSGTIPPQDTAALKAFGILEVFTAETSPKEIVAFIADIEHAGSER